MVINILFSFYYRRMLKKPFLELAPLGAFNLHGSLLPKFRGDPGSGATLPESAAPSKAQPEEPK